VKYKLSALIFIAFFMQSAYSSDTNTRPATCPSVEAIQLATINFAANSARQGWLGLNLRNKYDTSEEWSFMVMLGYAENAQDAIEKANAAISQLKFVDGPIERDWHDNKPRWQCLYNADGTLPYYFAMAETPAFYEIP
jgi:hypothetical protein